MAAAAYPHLTSPFLLRGHVLKNRMYASNSMLHFLQGPEPYPADGLAIDLVGRAKAGASIVTVSGVNTNAGDADKFPSEMDVAHFAHFDLYDPQCQNYLMQLADQIHLYQSFVSVGLFAASHTFPLRHEDGTMEYVRVHPQDTDIKLSTSSSGESQPVISIKGEIDDSTSRETLNKIRDSFVQQCVILQGLGFDMVTIHMCYHGQLLGQLISPKTNHRTDNLNGSIRQRGAYPLEVLRAIREACGPRFLIEIQITGEEEGGGTMEETVEFLRMCEGVVDIAQIRGEQADPCHPTGFNPEETPYLDVAARIKAAGVPVAIAGIAGFQDPASAERAVAEGKVDLVAMARAWISNTDYGKMVAEGRADDIVPCVRCNRCHGRGDGDPFVTVCTVNPLVGLKHRIPYLASPVTRRKRVAIIGGGPGGMRAALLLAERGHEPVVFEASKELGGAIRHADKVDFKWPLKQYKDFLIYQLGKQGIETHVGHAVTPEEISALGFDAVVAALGATPTLPPIEGIADVGGVFYHEAIFHPERLGQRVAIIGGGEVGTEVGIYLARQGKEATVMEMRPRLAADSTLIHYYSMFREAWEAEPLFRGITGARVSRVADGAVTYADADGRECELPYDSLVVAAGMRPRTSEALAFAGCAPEFHVIGDCRMPASIQQANRDALGVACVL